LVLLLASIPLSARPGSLEDAARVLGLSLDQQTIANVLLQEQAEPASALLPQWLSGYAFLFTMETNMDRAKEIRASLPAKMAAATEPWRPAQPGNPNGSATPVTQPLTASPGAKP
jgi:hypothetical protein